MKRFTFPYSTLLEHRRRQYTGALSEFQEWTTKTLQLETQIENLKREIQEAKNGLTHLFSAENTKFSDMQFQHWYLENLEAKQEQLKHLYLETLLRLEELKQVCVEKMKEKKVLEHVYDSQLNQHTQRFEKEEQIQVDEHFLGTLRKK